MLEGGLMKRAFDCNECATDECRADDIPTVVRRVASEIIDPISVAIVSLSLFHPMGYFNSVLITYNSPSMQTPRPTIHVAWRVTPTADLGKPLDLLLHLPSEEEEEEDAGRRDRRGRD